MIIQWASESVANRPINIVKNLILLLLKRY